MTLRQARILSSETDNTIKQEQNTNVNIKITPRATAKPWTGGATAKPWTGGATAKPQTVPVNFTLPELQQPNQDLHSQTVNQDYQSQSAQHSLRPSGEPPTNRASAQADLSATLAQERGVTDLGTEINDLEKKNSFLEMIVQMYESNPLKVNSYVVCESKLLMDMIKLLTECDKVELVINDSDVGCGCTASAKFMRVAKILITKDGKTEDMKYAYNDIYSQFIKYGISLKLVI